MSGSPDDDAARQRAIEDNADAALRLAAIVESSDDAIVSKSLEGIVTSWNGAAERMFGYSAAEMVGHSIRHIIPDDRQSEEDDVLAKLRRGERVDHYETWRRRKDGTLLPISLSVSPIRNRNGIVIGASKIARDISQRRQAEAERERLLAISQSQAAIMDRLNQVGSVVASALDRDVIIQAVTDAATELTTAQFGAFFRTVVDEHGESYKLDAVSGVPRETLADSPVPRDISLFDPTFRGRAVLRSDDVTKDTHYGDHPPHPGRLTEHLSVRSCLAVPVRARSGEVLGGLLFGHPDVARFTDQHERLATGIASWASVALENARLYLGVQEANRLKDEFLATLSHELRTPLNAILGYARMLRAHIVAPENQQRAIETVERNATSLTQIVEDVLDVSRIVSGKLRLDVQPVDLSEVVRSAVDAVLPAATAKGVRTETSFEQQGVPVYGDAERLQQVVWNLMTNAVKFTPSGGLVQVCVTRLQSHVEVVVRDTGIGIAAEFLPHVFEPFRQADGSINREHGGLGLGLGIARRLTEIHGGTIGASSDGPGLGATFRLTLPLLAPQSARARGGRVPAHQDDDAGHPEQTLMPDLHGVRVLAVDDEPDALYMVREILEAAGAQMWTASAGAEALEMVAGVRPDVLIVDLGMPRMDGYEFLAHVRGHAERSVRDVPAAALTAYARSEERMRSLRSGFQLHVTKPIDPVELMAAIAALAKRVHTD
jgi:PAS domain S-box-containing protein